MGTFTGHFVPGLYFCCFALWFAVNIFIRFCGHKYKKIPFKSSLTYPCPFSCCGKCKKWPIDGLVKITITSIGVIGETITGLQADHGFPMGNKQHILMYTFYGMTGVIDILLHHNFPVPDGTGFAGLIVAVTIELVLFRFHLHDREELDVHVHMLLVYTLVITILALLLQMKYRDQPLAALLASYLFFLQGTWFIQVGYILYNPLPDAQPWKQDDPEVIMLVTIYFAWHVGIVFVFYLLLSLLISCIYRKCYPRSSGSTGDITMQRLIVKDQNGHTHVPLNESESDIEYHHPLMQNCEEE